jgi:hypothetical protein
MRLKAFILAALATIAFATPAAAQLSIVVDSTSDLNAISIGETFTVNITLTTPTPEAQGLTLRVDGVNETVLNYVSATVPNFGGAATPNGAIFGTDLGGGIIISGLASVLAAPVDNGTNILLFDGVTTSPTTSSGPEVFTVTFDALAAGTVNLNVGAISAFGDAYVSTGGTTMPVTPVTITVPEPGAIAASLAALGSVFGVVTIRRRQDS